MGKRIISVLLIVGICLSVTACSPMENLLDIMNWITDNDNPLSGKVQMKELLCPWKIHIQNILFQQ